MTSASRSVEAPPAGRYRIDPAGSEIALTVKHLFGLATVHADVPIVSGELVITETGDPQAIVTASATGFDSGDERRDRAVKAAKFLDAQQHPTMMFTSTAVTRADGQWAVAGVLTAHGVQAPLGLVVTAVEGDAATGMTVRATGRVDRYQHGITAARGLAGRTIDLCVTARIALQA